MSTPAQRDHAGAASEAPDREVEVLRFGVEPEGEFIKSRSISTGRWLLALAATAAGCLVPGSQPPADDRPDGGSSTTADAGTAGCATNEDCASLPGWCDQGTCRDWGGSEGEGEQYLQPFVLQDDGAGLVETPLDESFGYAFAVARARGAPVVFAAESVGDALSGALLAHIDPFGAAPQTERFEGVLGSSRQRATGRAVDLDGDDDLDLIAMGNLRFGVVLDEGTEFRVAASQAADLRVTSVGVVDLDQDGVQDVYLPGLNYEYWTAQVVDGIVTSDRHVQRWQVGHYWYCPASFAGGEVEGRPVLLTVGRVCGADETVVGLHDGPDRLILLDEAMAEIASIDVGTEGGPAVTLRGATAYVSGRWYTANPDDDGGNSRGTLAIEVTPTGFGASALVAGNVGIAGFADVDGDGVDSWVGHADVPPSADFVRLEQGRGLTAVGDADGDGRDELFLGAWWWRQP